jgi:hypothetical protein
MSVGPVLLTFFQEEVVSDVFAGHLLAVDDGELADS